MNAYQISVNTNGTLSAKDHNILSDFCAPNDSIFMQFFLLVFEPHCHSLAKISFEFELYLCLFLHGFRIYDQCKSLKTFFYRKTVTATVLNIISNWKFNMIILHYSAKCIANFKKISLFFTELELCFWVPLFFAHLVLQTW